MLETTLAITLAVGLTMPRTTLKAVQAVMPNHL
jgi:hypothetical protein